MRRIIAHTKKSAQRRTSLLADAPVSYNWFVIKNTLVSAVRGDVFHWKDYTYHKVRPIDMKHLWKGKKILDLLGENSKIISTEQNSKEISFHNFYQILC